MYLEGVKYITIIKDIILVVIDCLTRFKNENKLVPTYVRLLKVNTDLRGILYTKYVGKLNAYYLFFFSSFTVHFISFFKSVGTKATISSVGYP